MLKTRRQTVRRPTADVWPLIIFSVSKCVAGKSVGYGDYTQGRERLVYWDTSQQQVRVRSTWSSLSQHLVTAGKQWAQTNYGEHSGVQAWRAQACNPSSWERMDAAVSSSTLWFVQGQPGIHQILFLKKEKYVEAQTIFMMPTIGCSGGHFVTVHRSTRLTHLSMRSFI